MLTNNAEIDSFQSFHGYLLNNLCEDRDLMHMLFGIVHSESESDDEVNFLRIGKAMKHLAYKIIYQKTGLTENLIKELNAIVTGKWFIPSKIAYSKQKRFVSTGFALQDSKLLEEYMTPELVPIYMSNLMNETERPEYFLLEFLRIHPFDDGNGRTAKLIYYLLSGKMVF